MVAKKLRETGNNQYGFLGSVVSLGMQRGSPLGEKGAVKSVTQPEVVEMMEGSPQERMPALALDVSGDSGTMTELSSHIHFRALTFCFNCSGRHWSWALAKLPEVLWQPVESLALPSPSAVSSLSSFIPMKELGPTQAAL